MAGNKEAQQRYREKHRDKLRKKALAQYYKHRARYLEYGRKRMKVRREALRWYKHTHPCVDCGLHDPRVLEFDHVPERGEVTRILSYPGSSTLEKLWKEIQKCDVVCANCHSIRTRVRRE